MERDWATEFTAHGLACGFLSKVFYERPTPDFIHMLVKDDLFADWPLETNRAAMHDGLERLRAFCAGWHDSQMDTVREDYAALFVGPGPMHAPPWESVYRSQEHLLFDRQTFEVRQAYARFGLQTSRLNVEPDDHIGLELTFVAHLCNLGIQAIEAGQADRLQVIRDSLREFVGLHLAQWANEFYDHVQQNAITDYYRGAALLGVGCLEELSALLEPVSSPC